MKAVTFMAALAVGAAAGGGLAIAWQRVYRPRPPRLAQVYLLDQRRGRLRAVR